jgi:hypothetical protein
MATARPKGRGGPGRGQGRQTLERLYSLETCEAIAHEFELRCQLRSSAAIVARARRTNPVRKKRWAIDSRIAAKASRFGGRDRIPVYEQEKLSAELEAAGDPPPFLPPKRIKGWRDIIEKEVADLFKHLVPPITPLTVRACVARVRTKAAT